MKQSIVFATGNSHKLQEINEIAKGTGIDLFYLQIVLILMKMELLLKKIH